MAVQEWAVRIELDDYLYVYYKWYSHAITYSYVIFCTYVNECYLLIIHFYLFVSIFYCLIFNSMTYAGRVSATSETPIVPLLGTGSSQRVGFAQA